MLFFEILFDYSNRFIHKFLQQFFPMEQKHFPQPFIDRKDDVAVVHLKYVLFQKPRPFFRLSA
jgi:hypothetical protein